MCFIFPTKIKPKLEKKKNVFTRISTACVPRSIQREAAGLVAARPITRALRRRNQERPKPQKKTVLVSRSFFNASRGRLVGPRRPRLSPSAPSSVFAPASAAALARGPPGARAGVRQRSRRRQRGFLPHQGPPAGPARLLLRPDALGPRRRGRRRRRRHCDGKDGQDARGRRALLEVAGRGLRRGVRVDGGLRADRDHGVRGRGRGR